jgi:hypothetical protein
MKRPCYRFELVDSHKYSYTSPLLTGHMGFWSKSRVIDEINETKYSLQFVGHIGIRNV